jgi:hypothetical protein
METKGINKNRLPIQVVSTVCKEVLRDREENSRHMNNGMKARRNRKKGMQVRKRRQRQGEKYVDEWCKKRLNGRQIHR